MISTIINTLRAFKSLYDLSFSEDQFYVQQRTEFLGGIHRCVEEARHGWRNPPDKTYVRRPFKVLFGVLLFVLILAAMVGGR